MTSGGDNELEFSRRMKGLDQAAPPSAWMQVQVLAAQERGVTVSYQTSHPMDLPRHLRTTGRPHTTGAGGAEEPPLAGR